MIHARVWTRSVDARHSSVSIPYQAGSCHSPLIPPWVLWVGPVAKLDEMTHGFVDCAIGICPPTISTGRVRCVHVHVATVSLVAREHTEFNVQGSWANYSHNKPHMYGCVRSLRVREKSPSYKAVSRARYVVHIIAKFE